MRELERIAAAYVVPSVERDTALMSVIKGAPRGSHDPTCELVVGTGGSFNDPGIKVPLGAKLGLGATIGGLLNDSGIKF